MTENAVEENSRRRRRRGGNAPEAEETASAIEADSVSYTPGKGRATPGRRSQEEQKEEGNVVTRTFGGVAEYFEEVRSEIDKVSWPTREEALRLTRVVLVVLVVSALVMGLINFLFQNFVAFGLQNPVVFVVLLAICVGMALWWFGTHDAPRKKGY